MPELHIKAYRYHDRQIPVGHPVRVLPSKKGAQDGFDALIRDLLGRVEVDEEGNRRGRVSAIVVTDPYTGGTRAFPADRVVPYVRDVEARAKAIAERNERPRSERLRPARSAKS